ncbi:MAG: hypothetical protein Q8P19_01750 [bacterium]|nr:hypothetical protein [bacterium]
MKKKRTARKQKVHTVEGLAVLVAEGFSDVARHFDAVDKRFDAMDKRFDAVDEDLRSIRAELSDIHRRLERLEEMGASQAGFAKEIDHLLVRVAKIEKHLRIV